MPAPTKTILVTGATGEQGGSTARELAAAGYNVKAFVRNPSSPAAIELQQANIRLCKGDFDNVEAIKEALVDVDGVFLNTMPVFSPGVELQQAKNILGLAFEMGVSHVVYASVANAGKHESIPGWGPDHPFHDYWIAKHSIECAVRDGGFKHWTILRPTFFMSNYLLPKGEYMFPQLIKERIILNLFKPDHQMWHVDGHDLGRYASAAFTHPEKFDKKEIALGSEMLSMREVAQALSKAVGIEIRVKDIEIDDAEHEGIPFHLKEAFRVYGTVPFNVDSEAPKEYDLPLITMSDFLKREGKALHDTFKQ